VAVEKQENVSSVVSQDFILLGLHHGFPEVKFSNLCLLLSSSTGYQIFRHGLQIAKHVRQRIVLFVKNLFWRF